MQFCTISNVHALGFSVIRGSLKCWRLHIQHFCKHSLFESFKSWNLTSEKRGSSCPNCGRGVGVSGSSQKKKKLFSWYLSSANALHWMAEMSNIAEGTPYPGFSQSRFIKDVKLSVLPNLSQKTSASTQIGNQHQQVGIMCWEDLLQRGSEFFLHPSELLIREANDGTRVR